MTNNTITWKTILNETKQKPYFQAILEFIKKERKAGKTIYPPQKDIFNAFKLTLYEMVKVVILGQDPYHGPNQAHGLAFSVRPSVATFPPSLQNIFKELHEDLNVSIPAQGTLEKWAKQGVLLLNTALTVEAGKPQSHASIGWHRFTDHVIASLNDHPQGIVFLLWGTYAQQKSSLITNIRHHILKASHPSPFSANRGFFGCQHFSKTNKLLGEMGREEIDWRL